MRKPTRKLEHGTGTITQQSNDTPHLLRHRNSGTIGIKKDEQTASARCPPITPKEGMEEEGEDEMQQTLTTQIFATQTAKGGGTDAHGIVYGRHTHLRWDSS